MNQLIKYIKEDFFILVLISMYTFASIMIGRYIFPTTSIIPTSVRMIDCEEKGGKYNLRFNEYLGNYVEECNVIGKEIKEF